MKASLFAKSKRSANYVTLQIAKDAIKPTIYQHPEFVRFIIEMNKLFAQWQKATVATLKNLQINHHPKEVIHQISESLLATYTDKPLINNYDVYQHLMNYWFATMQDDCYLIAADGWKADISRVLVENKTTKKVVDKGWTCDLIPKELLIQRYFAADKQAIEQLEAHSETIASQITELEEEHGGEEGIFAELDKVNKANVAARVKGLKGDKEAKEEIAVLTQYLDLSADLADTNKKIKDAHFLLDTKLLMHYPKLSEAEIKTLVVNDKWMATIDKDIHTEMARISQRLTHRIKDLAERYETPLPEQTKNFAVLESAVQAHLAKMGFVWR